MLLLAGSGGVDLGQLVLEQVELALARAGELAQLLELALKARALGERLRAGPQAQARARARRSRRGSQLGGRQRQLAVLVLAVEGDERARRGRAARRRSPSGRSGRRACARPRRRDGRARPPSASARQPLASSRSRSSPRQSKTPSTYASARPGRTIPAARGPPSSRSSAWASTVLPAPVSPVSTFRPGARRRCGPLDQQQVLDAQLSSIARRSSSERGRITVFGPAAIFSWHACERRYRDIIWLRTV